MYKTPDFCKYLTTPTNYKYYSRWVLPTFFQIRHYSFTKWAVKRLQFKLHMYMLSTEIFREIFKEESCIWIMVEITSGYIQIIRQSNSFIRTNKVESLLKWKNQPRPEKDNTIKEGSLYIELRFADISILF